LISLLIPERRDYTGILTSEPSISVKMEGNGRLWNKYGKTFTMWLYARYQFKTRKWTRQPDQYLTKLGLTTTSVFIAVCRVTWITKFPSVFFFQLLQEKLWG